MRKEFKLPDVGEGIAEAEIVEYLVEKGQEVKADQPVIRIETDKAVVELPAPVSGTIAEISHSPGDTVHVGDTLLIIETEAKEEAEPSKKKEAPPEKEKEEAPKKKKEEEEEEKAPPPEKEKEAPPPKKEEEKEKEAPREKEEEKKKAPPPEKETPTRKPEHAEEEGEEKAEPSREPKRVLATPHTRRLARELGVDITTVEGTGRGGRITDEDVRKASSEAEEEKAKAKAAPAAPKAPTAAAIQAPATAGFDFEQYGPTRREPLKGVRKRTAEVMARSVSTIPHVTHFDEADVTEMLQVIEQQRSFAEERKVKLTILSFLTKAAADALKKYPWFNSSLDESTGELVFKDYYNVGFATDTEAGLMVPVVRDVDKKSILQIAGELQELSGKARDRSIDLQDMRGGTFTISNVGALGGMWATPIIVHPQVAILCSLRAKKKPVVRDDEVVARTIMPLTVSFDHRVLDGADAARFLSHIVQLLEDPMRMLVDVA